MRRVRVAAAAIGVLAATVPQRAGAQQLVAMVRDSSGAPAAGAHVTLLDSLGRPLRDRLADAGGRAAFATTYAGRHHVLVRRIGFRPFTSRPIAVAATGTTTAEVVVGAARVELASVQVQAAPKACRNRDARGAESFALWEQVAAAVRASELAARDLRVTTQVRTFERWLNSRGEAVALSEQAALGGARPFAAEDPALLSTLGWVQRDSEGMVTYYGLDARALLSESFIRDHCFRIVRGSGDRAALIGLAFEPVRGRSMADIEGTAWVDTATSELRDIAYRYVSAPHPARAALAGGDVTFARLPSGAWIIRAWTIRMPRFRQEWSETGAVHIRTAGYVEAGGIATVMGTVDVGQLPRPGEQAPLERRTGDLYGIVRDSVTGRPIGGVMVSHGVLRSRTDSLGVFLLQRVPHGLIRLTLDVPRGEGRPVRTLVVRDVEVLPEQESTVTLHLGRP